MRIVFDDELLAVQQRENHRHDHGGGIVEGMKKGSGKKDSFFHRGSEFGYIPIRNSCQLRVEVVGELDYSMMFEWRKDEK